MNIVKLQKKFPSLSQEDLFGVIEKFRNIDIDEKGWVEKQQVLDAVSKSGEASYDEAREALKACSVDASGRVELDDYVELEAKLKESQAGPPPQTSFATATPVTQQSMPSQLQHKGKIGRAHV